MSKPKKKQYEKMSPAVHITVYDLSGAPLSQEVVKNILDAVHQETADDKLAISFTRT